MGAWPGVLTEWVPEKRCETKVALSRNSPVIGIGYRDRQLFSVPEKSEVVNRLSKLGGNAEYTSSYIGMKCFLFSIRFKIPI